MQAGVLRLLRMHLKSAIISKYMVEILRRNPAKCTKMRYGAEFRSEARTYSMTACVQTKTARSTGDGRVIHAWNMVRIDDYLAIEKLTPLTGDHPEYQGWVALERVLNQKPRV